MSSPATTPDDMGMDTDRNTDPKGQDMETSIDTQTLAAKVDRARAALRNAEYDLRRAQDSIDTQTLAAKVDRARAALRNAEYDLRRAQDNDRAIAAARVSVCVFK